MYSQDLTISDDIEQASDTAAGKHQTDSPPDATLDLGNIGCPLLGLKSMSALRRLKRGQTIEITSTHPGARKALGRVSWMTKSKLIAVHEEGGHFTHVLRKV